MKKLTMFFALAMAVCYCHAQLATPAQIGEMLKSGKQQEAIKAATQLYKKNKKDVNLICDISRVFLTNDDTESAMDFALKADAAAKSKSAKVHCLIGDIWYTKDEGGNATQEYAQAITVDPNDTIGYVRYANVYKDKFPDEAIAKLNELKAVRPDVDVDKLIARAMYNGHHEKEAAKYYAKCDMNTLAIDDISSYAFAALFGIGDANKALEIAQFGASKNSQVAVFPRIQLYSLASLGKNEEALEVAKKLFDIVGDGGNMLDYQFYGGVLNGVNRNEEAIAAFRKAMEISPERTDILTKIAATYSLMKDFDNATKTMDEYFAKAGEAGQTFDNYSTLADIYVAKARAISDASTAETETEQNEVKAAVEPVMAQAFATYDKAIAKKPHYFLGYYNKGVAQYAFGNIEGAKESFSKVAEILEAEGTNKSYLKAAYTYLGNCYIKLEDTETGKAFQEKAAAI